MKGCQILGLEKIGKWFVQIKFATLQWDKDGLQGHVQVQEKNILKLKEEIHNIVHQRDEVVRDKDKIQATFNRSI
jgi:putative lipase involved disintegration of autophagic bodies